MRVLAKIPCQKPFGIFSQISTLIIFWIIDWDFLLAQWQGCPSTWTFLQGHPSITKLVSYTLVANTRSLLWNFAAMAWWRPPVTSPYPPKSGHIHEQYHQIHGEIFFRPLFEVILRSFFTDQWWPRMTLGDLNLEGMSIDQKTFVEQLDSSYR